MLWFDHFSPGLCDGALPHCVTAECSSPHDGNKADQATNAQTVFKVEATSLLLRSHPSVHTKILRLQSTLNCPSTHVYNMRTYLVAGWSPGHLDECDWGTGSLASFNWVFASSWVCSFRGATVPGNNLGAWAQGASKWVCHFEDMGFSDFQFVVICEGWVSISHTVLTYGSHSWFQMTEFLSSIYIWMWSYYTQLSYHVSIPWIKS